MALLKGLNEDKGGKKLPQKFNIEWQFNEYLRRSNADPAKMSPVQYNEMKKCFFGAWGQLLMSLKHDFGPYNAMQTVEICQNMTNQVLHFFQKQTGKEN